MPHDCSKTASALNYNALGFRKDLDFQRGSEQFGRTEIFNMTVSHCDIGPVPVAQSDISAVRLDRINIEVAVFTALLTLIGIDGGTVVANHRIRQQNKAAGTLQTG